MIYLLIILFAFWNGFVIRWEQNKFDTRQTDSKIWHKIGVLNRGGLWLIAILSQIGNPIMLLFDKWWAEGITTILIIGLSYWIYNLIINKINRWKWDYQKELTTQLYHISLIIYLILLTTVVILSIIYGLKI